MTLCNLHKSVSLKLPRFGVVTVQDWICALVCVYIVVYIYIYICFLFSVVACVQHLSLLQEDIERESASEEVEHGPRLGMGMNGSCQSA